MGRFRNIALTLLEVIAIVISSSAQQVRIGNAGVTPNGAMIPPTLIQSTLAPYTAEAVNRGLEGAVTLEAHVDTQGIVRILRVVQGLGSGLDENAALAVHNWEFRPALRNGVPVEVICQIDVYFNLRAANAFRVGQGVTAPTILQRVEPAYTPEARSRRLQGTVVLQALIRKDGTIDILRVIRGLDAGLTDSAIQALKQWQFAPGMKDKLPVDISVNIEVNFNLKPDQR